MSLLNSVLFFPVLLLLRYLASNFLFNHNFVNGVSWNVKEWNRELKQLADESIYSITQTQYVDYQDFNDTLDAILIPRVPGTEGHRKVKHYIKSTLSSLNWNVEEDNFKANTPHGNIAFTNIIATLNPKACKRVVLACHYDSKHTRSGKFVGATDSAVPCAMLLHLIKTLDPYLKAHRDRFPPEDTTLQLIFFDGEEAFVQWNENDSIYGARHLARKWNHSKFPKNTEEQNQCAHIPELDSEIDRIEVLILLDLLGSSNPNFYSYFPNTNALYARLIRIEQRLNDLKQLEGHPPQSRTSYFENRQVFGGIEDDHIPFLRRDVPILHIIPSPFPSVWHRESDNKENLHHPTISNLNKIFRVFISEYLHLTVS